MLRADNAVVAEVDEASPVGGEEGVASDEGVVRIALCWDGEE